jgi:hypothetical protein
MQQHGTFSASACDRTGSVGGCRVTFSGQGISFTTTTWSFPPVTAAQIMMQCSQVMGQGITATFVTP